MDSCDTLFCMELITISAIIKADIDKVWTYWNEPEHITKWAFASDDWECPYAENDLRIGGTFTSRMQAKDGSAGFDFSGTYTSVVPHERIEYVMTDGRKVTVVFENTAEGVSIVETFDPENENSREMQQAGWQAILDTFKKYVETT